jgi:hypothetical protein
VDYDCIGEKIHKENGHGMAAGILNSRYGWGMRNSTDGPSQWYDREFFDAYFGEYFFNLGVINADSHEDNTWRLSDTWEGYARWCMYQTNLFGDPHMVLNGMSAEANVIFSKVKTEDQFGGNNDGVVNPGEFVNLTVTLKNIGLEHTNGVSAVLSTEDAYVTITDGNAEFGDIPGAGASKEALDPFAVLVGFNCPTPHEVTFDLVITDENSTEWTDSFTVMVYTSYRITGTVTLDGNPLKGATIQYSGPLSGSVMTDSRGCYTVGNIDGSVTLVAQKDDFLACDPVTLSMPPDHRKIDFAFTTATVSGRVTDVSTGGPIEGVVVEYDGPVSGSVKTDSSGRYVIRRVFGHPADLELTVKKDGYFDSA